METPHLLIYLIINILLLIFSFIYQLNIRYITDKGKNKNKKIRKIISEHSLDHSSSTLNELNETYKNLSNEEEKEFNGKEEGNLIENINIMNEN
jgi:competence protein ComGC